MTPLELADLIEAMGDAVPLGEEIVEAIRDQDELITTDEERDEAFVDAGAALSAYLVAAGLPAHPVSAEGLPPGLWALVDLLHG